MDEEKIIKAGKIASQVKDYAREIVKKGVPLLELSEKIEAKIYELGGKPAFPNTLSIDEVAAHYTPSHDDEKIARGLISVDLGVHIDGWCSDTAFTLDLENSEENKKLIKASEDALNKSIETFGEGVTTGEIGKAIQKEIESHGFKPVMNLSGHAIGRYDLHAGDTIPNIDDKSNCKIKQGLYATEPFVTNGSGKIHDGGKSGILMLIRDKSTRSPIARQVLEFIKDEYGTLPFASRWIVKKFGTKALIGLNQLEEQGILHHYTILVEVSGSKVAQTENCVLITKSGEKVVTTK